LRTLLALLLIVVTWSPAAAEDGKLPSIELTAPDSHLAARDRFQGEVRAAFDAELARYDAYAASHPEDSATAIARCRFLNEFDFYEDDWAGLQELLGELQESCLTNLHELFPFHPEVALYRVESSYGPERVALATEVLEGARAWPASVRARVRKLLAEALEGEDPKRAHTIAQLAYREAPDVDVALLLARAAIARGDKPGAIAILSERLEGTTPPHSLPQKAQLLAELGAHPVALRALELAASQPYLGQDQGLRARILQGLGRVEEARAAYAQLTGHFVQRDVRQRALEFQLQHGSAADAAAAYEALDAAAADTFGGERLRLLWYQPGVALSWRDAGRVLALLSFMAVCFGLPFLGALPVHYVGLLRKERGRSPALADTPWTLPRTAALVGTLLVLQILLTWLLAPSELNSWFHETAVPRQSDPSAARYLLLNASMILVLMVVAVRPARIAQLLQVERPWSELRAELRRGAGLLFLVAVGNRLLQQAIAPDAEVVPTGLLAELLSTREMLRATAVHFGAAALLFCTVISAPIAEELLFRYVLTDSLQRHLTWGWAVGLQGAAFALVHDAHAYLPTLLCLGLITARLRRRSGSLLPPMLLHAGWNLLASLAILARAR
jgi:membrane protease YdiL (CAAX protease family)